MSETDIGEQHRLIAKAMNEGSPQAKALGFSTLEIGGGVFEVVSTSGDTQLGGTDMNQRIFEQLDERFHSTSGIDVRGDRKAAARLLEAYRAMDVMGALSYRVWYYAALHYDQDQRDNAVNARRQQVQILFAKSAQSSAWFEPELLAIPLDTMKAWLASDTALGVYRFAIEEVYRLQEHVLDEEGERLLSLSSRLSGAPNAVIAHEPSGKFDLDALKKQAREWPGLVGMDLVPKVTSAQRFTWAQTYARCRRLASALRAGSEPWR